MPRSRSGVVALASLLSSCAAFQTPLRMSADLPRRAVAVRALGAAGLALLPGATPAAAAAELAAVGATAPDFDLPVENLSGKGRAGLGDFDGKWKVLYFYPQDDSAGCTLEAKKFQAALPEIRKLGAEVIGVSPQDLSSHNKFIAKLGLDYPLVSDAKGDLASKYGAQISIPIVGKFTNRETYLVDPKNVVRWKDKNVEFALDGHAANVVSQLKQLQ